MSEQDEHPDPIGRAEQLVRQNTFVWGDQKRYKCPDCGFDSYSVQMVAKHWIAAHYPEKAYRIESGQPAASIAVSARRKKKAGRPPRHPIQADRVKNLRDLHGGPHGDHSQPAFARSVGISVDVLAAAENDGEASDETISKICRYAKRKGLDLKAEDLKKNHP